jgi:cytosine/adenosine deaminase-related metal-dependent hydrolase
MIFGSRPIAFVNARVVTPSGLAPSIRICGRVLEIGGEPRGRDRVFDLEGAFVLPGLINAHDHLELNHYGSLKGRERYDHANDWIDDLRPLLQTDPAIRRNAQFPLADRLFIGGLKNLLSGVTTVAHHNPRYRAIGRRFPVRVLARYGWAHSFAMEHERVGAGGEPGGDVAERCRATPPTQPFMVHVGEGVDGRAVQELARFAESGCLRPNSVIVHGVAHTTESWQAAVRAKTSLAWCPASNRFLFGRTVPLSGLIDSMPASRDLVCLGSDSRLTGARDLLDEMREAATELTGRAGLLIQMVTSSAADVLRLKDAGRLVLRAAADLIVVPPDETAPGDPERALLAARRSRLRLVMIGGRPVVGDVELRALFDACGVRSLPLQIDNAPKVAAATVVRRLARCAIAEPGVEAIA